MSGARPLRLAAARHAGQSAVEFLVLALALLPLFLLLPLLGKYLDLGHATEHAARYVAFESAIAGPAVGEASAAALARDVRRRHFGNADAPILTGDRAEDIPAHRNPLWSDHRGLPLIEDFAARIDVRLESRTDHQPASALLAGRNGLDLPAATEFTAHVTVSPRQIDGLPPFDHLPLQIARHHVILRGNWSASGTTDVSRHIRDSGLLAYPVPPLELIGNTVGRLLPPLMLDKAIDIGRMRPEIVPCDRLEQGC